MKLDISPNRTIGQVQDEFNALFPDLKIVFFTKPHKAYKGSPAKFLVTDRDTPISTLLTHKHIHSELLFEDDMPVWQFERHFEMEYGLHIQVFRRSGNTWLETSVSDDMPLEQQEVKGRDSKRHNFEFIDPLDYREQD